MEPDSDMAEQRGQQQAPSSSEDKPFADFAYLPGQRLTGVLVPAFVSKVEDTVQRMANLQQALRGESEVLMLRLRQDPLSRPLLGTKREPASSEILLRVVHRVSRTTGAIESSRFTPVGMVDQSWEFTSLADFQVADARPLSKRPKIGMREETDEFLSRMQETEPILTAPPMFAALNQPWDYRFRTSKQTQRDEKIGSSHVLSWDQPVPSVCRVVAQLDARHKKDWLDRLTRLFNEVRPVWTVDALSVVLWRENPAGRRPLPRILKRVLPWVAINFKTGPFRKAWVRYGYDVRTQPLSRFYQIIDFRDADQYFRPKQKLVEVLPKVGPSFPSTGIVAPAHIDVDQEPLFVGAPHALVDDKAAVTNAVGEDAPASGAKAKPKSGRKLSSGKKRNLQAELADVEELEGVLTFSKPLPNRQALMQLCDVHYDPVQVLVFSPATPLGDRMDKTSGWYQKGFLDDVRARMKTRHADMKKDTFTPVPAALTSLPLYADVVAAVQAGRMPTRLAAPPLAALLSGDAVLEEEDEDEGVGDVDDDEEDDEAPAAPPKRARKQEPEEDSDAPPPSAPAPVPTPVPQAPLRSTRRLKVARNDSE